MDELLEALEAGIHALHDTQKQDPVLRTDMELAIRIFNIEEAYSMLARRVAFLKYTEEEIRASPQSKES
jgi:hypothetical protein